MGFAGSQRLDERRRRRLATDALEPKKKNTIRRIDQSHANESVEVTAGSSSPILTWMPRVTWPLALVTLLSASLTGFLLASAIVLDRDAVWGPIVGVHNGRVVPFFSALAAFAAAQVCFIIFWYRKRSRRDFNGGYRRWMTAAGAMLFLAFCFGTNIHQPLSALLSQSLPPAVWNTPAVCCVVFLGGVTAILGPALLKELRSAGTGVFLYLFGLLAAIGACALTLIGDIVLSTDECFVWCRLMAFMATWCVFHAFWWHARHVIRVSNEPPQQGQIRSELKRMIPKRKRSKASDDESDTDDATDPESTQATKRPKRRRRQQPQEIDEEYLEADGDESVSKASFVGRGVARVKSTAAAPFVGVASKWSSWKESRAEAKAEKLAAKEQRREEKAQLAEQKQAEKLAAIEAKAEAKRAAADEKAAAKEAKRRAVEQAKLEKKQVADEAAADKARRAEEAKAAIRQAAAEKKAEREADARVDGPEEPPKMTAAERRAARKARKQQRQAAQQSENLVPAELQDDFDDEDDRPRGKRRRRRG